MASRTAVATVAALGMVGATTSEHYIMDPGELAEVLDRPQLGVPPIHTVTPVDIFGRPAAKVATCRMPVVEDCAQVNGALGKPVAQLCEAPRSA